MGLTSPQWVGLWIVANLVGVGLYDVFAAWQEGPDKTVTAVLRSWAILYPALPFLVGFLAGHLFGR